MDTIYNKWRTVSSRIAYENKWMKIREDKVIRPDGREGLYGVIETAPSVYIVPLSEKEEIYLIGQFRYPTQMASWEIPAGGSDNEDLMLAAKRELKEELGLESGEMIKLGVSQQWNGLSNEIGSIFLARELKEVGGNEQAEEGISAFCKIPLEDALALIRNGTISDSQTITAVMMTLLYLKKI
ncbi:MAG: NUDIX hydrolase [bacterium]|nr:NUDIX hydrolase [bacterium]